jgi:hypothetical protein
MKHKTKINSLLRNMNLADAILRGKRALEALWLTGRPGEGHGEEVQ